MPREIEMPKSYDASTVENGLYAKWEESGAFNPDRLPERNLRGEPYCIMMPPPNRTGTLHLGHAMGLAVEDLLARFERMRGKKVLWLPGTDHAAIATQVKVEQLLIKEGMKDPRRELGREKFLERVVAFAEESGRTIVNQTRKMGSSCDWSRERYTFDEERNRAVNEMFRMMFEDGLIERGLRVVNWDPQFQTTLSDDELESEEVQTKLYTFRYDASFPIAISTTRPETKFGDAAVAVHPDDARYQQFIGKIFEPVFCGKKLMIKIVADAAADPAFGTGAVGVTPAHSFIDAEIAERHGLSPVQVIDERACMTAEAGEKFVGSTTLEARAKVVALLEENGLIEKTEDVTQALPIAQRGGAVVEQLPMRQWFVRVNKSFKLRQATLGKWKMGESVTLKELMRYAVESNQIKIVPERFVKVYFQWIDHLRDWCISRQIWFGHGIPVWYRNSETKVSVQNPGEGWIQDPDTLDTWFSSGMWTFSALGWPDKKTWDEHRAFHPTAVLETGYDLIFFWIARMILMSVYALGEVPFRDVYLHGLVRDEQGRKMSKSLGNVLDPLELIPKFGTDAVRLSLLIGSTPGQDSRLSEEKIQGFRNFTNKLWNISRFILTFPSDAQAVSSSVTLADQWIENRLNETVLSVTNKLAAYQFSSAGEELRDFTWNDLADWYLEIAKVEGGKAERLQNILQTLLKLWHPFMPFVTEHVWELAGWSASKGLLLVAPWPEANLNVRTNDGTFERLRSLVTDLRRLRTEQKIEPAKKVSFVISGATTDERKTVSENDAWIKRLVNASALEIVETVPSGFATAISGSLTLGLDIAGTVDLDKERERLSKELEQVSTYLTTTQTKLQNQDFVSKAPASVVENMQAKLKEAQAKKISLEQRRDALEGSK